MSEDFDGLLGDPKEREKMQQAEKRARRQIKEDVYSLSTNSAFMRFIGRYTACLLEEMGTTNGGDLQQQSGRRAVALRMLNEFMPLVPDFYERVLAFRRSFQVDLAAKESPDE